MVVGFMSKQNVRTRLNSWNIGPAQTLSSLTSGKPLGREHRLRMSLATKTRVPPSLRARPAPARKDYWAPEGGAGRKATRHSKRYGSKSPMLTRFWLASMAGGISLVLSFVVTMQITKPSRPLSPGLTALMGSVVSDSRTLMAAVKAAGLKGSSKVKGSIDEVKRLDGDRVLVKGWAAEIGNSGTPLSVIFFADGKSQLTVETEGQHPDVAQALGLSDAPAAMNVSFQGRLACSRGQKLMVVAVTSSDSYGQFGSRACP